MGLDVRAYSQCVFVHEPHGYNEECDDRIPVRHQPWVDVLDGRSLGCYEHKGETFHFRAGSYGGYGDWRRSLSVLGLGTTAETVWHEPGAFAGEPFVELVNFSDCEGAIGPATSEKLAADFATHRDAAASGPDFGGYFLAKYDDWHKAFTLASDDGWVVLH